MSKKIYVKRSLDLTKEDFKRLKEYKGVVLKYSEICKILEIPMYAGGKAGGRQVKQHIKQMQRFADIRKVNGGYIVKAVYNVVRDPKARKRRTLKYTEAITCLDYSLTRDMNTVKKRSKNRLREDAGLVNHNFAVAAANVQATAKILNVSVKSVIAMTGYFGNRLKLNADSILKRSRATKDYIKGMVLAYEGRHRMADPKQIQLVDKIERVVLNGLSCKTKEGAYLKGRWEKFISRRNAILERQYNIKYVYNGYQMRVNKKTVRTTPVTAEQARLSVAQKVGQSILNAVKKKGADESFINDMKVLIEKLIMPTDYKLEKALIG